MVIFIILFDAQQHFVGVVNRGFFHLDGLEAAFECGILFNVFAVLVKGGCADNLNFSAGKRRLHNIRRIHCALGIACADQIMHLVDKQNDIALGLHLVNKTLNAAFKLPAELRTCNKRG